MGQDVDRLGERLENSVRSRLERSRLRCEGLSGKLSALSPVAILERGYAIARLESGAVLRHVAEASPGDAVRLTLVDGDIAATIEGRG